MLLVHGGLCSSVSLDTTKRTKEFALRIALGAQRLFGTSWY